MAAHTALQTRLRALANASGADGYADALAGARATSRVTSDDASLVTSDGASITASVYQIDMTTGDVIIGGTHGTIAALADQDLLADVTAFDLAGAAPAALDDGDSYNIVALAVLVDDVPELVFVFGDAAVDGAETMPTLAECREAVRLGAPADYLSSGLGIAVATINAARAGATVTLTHSNPAADDAVKGWRLAGALA